MFVTVDETLASQISATSNYLAMLGAAGTRGRNDRERFRSTLEMLDKLAVAAHAAMTPTTTFLGSSRSAGARFEAGNGSTVAKALDKAVNYLRDEDVASVPQNSLSMYEFTRTSDALDCLKQLHFSMLTSIRKAAEDDLQQMMSDDVERFLSTAELIRTWSLGPDQGEDPGSDS